MVGNDSDLHSFTQTFCRVFSDKRLDYLDQVRVYIIPSSGINTLAHWLALKDDLYCQNVFQAFKLNPLINLYRGKSNLSTD